MIDKKSRNRIRKAAKYATLAIERVDMLLANEDEIEYKEYGNPEAVGGWKGWYEVRGTVLAFLDTNNRLSFDW